LFSAKVTIFSEERTPRPANSTRKRRRRINFDSKHAFFQKEKIKIKEMLAFYLHNFYICKWNSPQNP